jgi:hypothetical protein
MLVVMDRVRLRIFEEDASSMEYFESEQQQPKSETYGNIVDES